MHMTFYRCFDRLSGSCIINEFLKNRGNLIIIIIVDAMFKEYTALSRKVVFQTGKSLRDNVENHYR